MDRIALKIVKLVADALIGNIQIEQIGYWIAQYSVGNESEYKLLTLAHSIIDNIKETNERNRKNAQG